MPDNPGSNPLEPPALAAFEELMAPGEPATGQAAAITPELAPVSEPVEHSACISAEASASEESKPVLAEEVTGLSIDKNSEFFIAIVKKDKGLHSSLMLGVMQNGKPTLLAKIGKDNRIDRHFPASPNKMVCKNLFTHTEAEMSGESLKPSGKTSYAAFSINYEHYKKFLQLAVMLRRQDNLRREEAISCYQPLREEGDTVVMTLQPLELQGQVVPNAQEEGIIKRSHAVSVGNTCRHTAVEMVEYTQDIRHLTDNVSRNFLRKLPLSAAFSYGKPDRHFYVFPLPPTAYKEADKETVARLNKIYRRMENVVKKDPYGKNTIEKFEALKELYNEQAGKPNADIGEVLQNLVDWKRDHADVIKELRKQSFFGKLFVHHSSTEKMVEKMERSLQPCQ